MRLVRRLARAMLGTVFVSGGIGSLRDPAGPAALAEPLARRVRAATGIPLFDDVPTLVRIDGAVKVCGGILLAVDRLPRLAALALAASLAPTTYVGHPFWREDPEARSAQWIQFAKNATMFGGLVLAATEPRGRRRREPDEKPKD